MKKVKTTWLDMEDLVKMIPIGRVLSTLEMNRLVSDFNSGKIALAQIKKTIKESKKVSMRDFLK
jgi:hypothetical protein